MGCGSSKESHAAAPAENARPAQTTGGAAPQTTQRHDQASLGQHPPASSGAVTEKAASPQRNKDNPVVYFDVSIGGTFLFFLCWLPLYRARLVCRAMR
jgi:hypothetical protein